MSNENPKIPVGGAVLPDAHREQAVKAVMEMEQKTAPFTMELASMILGYFQQRKLPVDVAMMVMNNTSQLVFRNVFVAAVSESSPIIKP